MGFFKKIVREVKRIGKQAEQVVRRGAQEVGIVRKKRKCRVVQREVRTSEGSTVAVQVQTPVKYCEVLVEEDDASPGSSSDAASSSSTTSTSCEQNHQDPSALVAMEDGFLLVTNDVQVEVQLYLCQSCGRKFVLDS